MRRALIITATALSGLSIAASLYFNYKKQSLASRVSHSSKRGQLSPSTPRNISSLPLDIFNEEYYAVYDYSSVSTPLRTLPELSPCQLLTLLIRRNMSYFASSPQACLLKLTADSDADIRRSFDPVHLTNLQFEEGDLVCNAYRVLLRNDEKVEFEFVFGVQGRLVVCVEVAGDEVIFHNETLMWRGVDEGVKMPLERGLVNWVHEYTAWWMLSSGSASRRRQITITPSASPMTSTAVMPVRSRTSLRASRRDPDPDPSDMGDNDTEIENTVQPPPPKRPRLNNPLPSRRRKSSPDLLDTTIDSTPSATSTCTKLRRPRPLFALSSAHAQTTSSPPPPGAGAGRGASNTPRARNLRLHHHDTPNSTAALHLNGGRESPDPLDTISPAPAPSAPSTTATPTSAAYRQRCVTQFFKTESESEKEQARSEPPKAKDPNPTPNPNSNPHPARANALPPPLPPPDNPIPSPQVKPEPSLSVPVPVETADRAKLNPELEPEAGKRRSLRSHDGGSRVKSDLALYFPNYDQLISLEPPKTELLSGNTVIKLIDDLTEPPIPPSAYSALNAETPFGNPLVNLHNCEVITLPTHTPFPPSQTKPASKSNLRASTSEKDIDPDDSDDFDPLHESHFFKPHRRHERQEKQLRNIERDRAQHEKQQLDRLLEELKSQDWLRALGVGGTGGRSLSEADKKLYEPKRDYFIREISAVLQKFKIWKEEEKRTKVDKEKPINTSFHSDVATALDPSHASKAKDNANVNASGTNAKDEIADQEEDEDTSDVDTLAARQLLQEARSATSSIPNANINNKLKRPSNSISTTKLSSTKHPRHSSPPPPPPLPSLPIEEPSKSFTSFFSKPHLREQAMSSNRKGRTRLAFGHPVPDVAEKEFELPGDILTNEAVRDCARRRRRAVRESLSKGAGGRGRKK
ncbi:something about silencing, SAS, complex subunit 4-domain-containing protein [Aspergillus oleicola]